LLAAGPTFPKSAARTGPPIALAWQDPLKSQQAAGFSRWRNLPHLCNHLKLLDYLELVAAPATSRVKTISIKLQHNLPVPKAIAGTHPGLPIRLNCKVPYSFWWRHGIPVFACSQVVFDLRAVRPA